MRAEKDMATRVNNDAKSSIGRHRSAAIDGNDKETVKGNQKESVTGNKLGQVLGNLMQSTTGQRILNTVKVALPGILLATLLGGRMADLSVLRTLVLGPVLTVATLLAFTVTAHGQVTATVTVFVLTIVMAVWLLRSRTSGFRAAHPRFQALRGVLLLLTSSASFFGVQYMPVAEFTAINMLTPVVVTLLAGWVLHERVSLPRWLLVCGGFAGALIVIRLQRTHCRRLRLDIHHVDRIAAEDAFLDPVDLLAAPLAEVR